MASHLPPQSSAGVFSVSSSSLINAPREKVWEILMDFPSYNEWNAFVRSQTVVDVSKNLHPDPTPAEGKFLSIKVHIPPTMGEPGIFGRGSAFVIITTLDPVNYRASWKLAGVPHFLLHTERWQTLSLDEATGQTKYETIEVSGGILAYFVKFFVGRNLKLGFQAFADCLKTRAEQT